MENGTIYTTEEKMNILRVKDYLNSEYLDKWLEIAEGIIEENVKNFEDLSAEKESYREQIVKLNEDLNNESDEGIKKDLEKEIFNLSQEADGKEIEISKYLKENKNKSDSEFIIGELKKIKDRSFLTELKNSVESESDDEEKRKKNELIDELEEILNQKVQLITTLKERLSNATGPSSRRRVSILVSTRDPEKENKERLAKTPALYENFDDDYKAEVNGDETEEEGNDIKSFLTNLKKKLEKSEEEKEKELFELVKKALENPDIKVGCEELLDEWNTNYSDFLPDLEDKRFLLEFSVENWDDIELEENKSSNSENSSETSEKEEEIEKVDEVAQDWLVNNYENNKDDETEIFVPKGENIKLIGDLEISDYPELEIINLKEMGINKLVINNCSQLEEIEVYGNEITEIIGLENLPELTTLSVGKNKLVSLDISKNPKLDTLLIFDNPGVKIIGLQNLTKLTEFNGGRNSLNLWQVNKEELEEAALGLGIKKEKIESLSPEEIKVLIKEEGEKSINMSNALKEEVGFDPGNDDDWNSKLVKKLGGKKLVEIPKTLKELCEDVEVLEKDVKEYKQQAKTLQKEVEKSQKEVKEQKEKVTKLENAQKETDKQLVSKIGDDGLVKLKEKVAKALEKQEQRRAKLEAKIEVS